ncbi:cysteine desulfurase family protein (TIGR01976 family) [Friedmanniella endophytica]|uniref:Cysteine desulfurase family protein (TIGR01976 family) n=1 Tax=Microlunatus kandeliicorticis TaxID=1759536 RepID=A0A7W3IV96_9ACTN|nr:cysteine desulfurase-like protein [Microlunatus kandeliicorticis]MBA8795896.1 cysteine desulfurase family protein (TIGR01976 family) [Microlunatus kandeliicorticis]
MSAPSTARPSEPAVASGGSAAPAFDVAAFRAGFPSLTSGIAHFDGPGGTQTPSAVGRAIAETLTGPLSNRGTRVASERNASAAVEAFRSAYADLLGAAPETVVFGRSATQLTYDFSRHLSGDAISRWQPGDEVVVSRLDHDANVRPWVQAASRRGATVRWIDLDPATGELDLDSLAAALSPRTRLVAVTAASNLIGTRPPIAAIAEQVHAVGALLHVDAVHFAAHGLVDREALGADLLVCSPYKFFGPHCAVLVGDPGLLDRIRPDKLVPSTDRIPERFEFGTMPYEILAGATAAVDLIAGLAGDPAPTDRRAALVAAHAAIGAHETRLRTRIEDGLAALADETGAGITLHARAADRTPTQLVTVAGRSMAEAADFLATRDVLAPAGTFYAVEPARVLDLPDPAPMRIGVAAYTDDADVDRLLDGLRDWLTGS